MAVQAATLPIVAFHFFKIPVYGMFLNLIVIPLMAYVLYFGIAGIVLGSGAVAAGAAALWPGNRILDLYEDLSIWVSSLPGNQFLVEGPYWEEILVYYVCLLVGRYAAGTSVRRLWILLAAAVLSGPLLLKYQPASGLSITCLNRDRERNCIPVWRYSDFSGWRQYGSEKSGHKDSHSFFGEQSDWRNQLRHCQPWRQRSHQRVKNTNGRTNHKGILPSASGTWKRSGDLRRIGGVSQKAQNGQVFYIGQNDSIREGKEGLSLTCLYPAVPGKDQKLIEERNDHSLVMRAEYGTFSMILTGDLGSSGEEDMLSKIEIPKTVVLKAGHHGSRESSSPRFLRSLTCKWQSFPAEEKILTVILIKKL